MPAIILCLCLSACFLPALDLAQLEGSWRVDNERSWTEVQTVPLLAQQLSQATPEQAQAIKLHVFQGFDEMTSVVSGGVITNTVAGKAEAKKLLSWTSISAEEATCVLDEEQGRTTVHLNLLADGAVRLTAVNPQPAQGAPERLTLILMRVK